jgi:G3E family GTPase
MNLDGIIVVADAESVRTKVVDKYVGPTVSRQLACADLIVLNKVDLVSREECGELMTWLSGIGDARIVHTTRSRVPLEVLLGQHVPAEGRRPDWREVPHDHFEQYVSWSFTTDKVFTSRAARLFAESLPAAVIRAKGFIGVEGGDLLVLNVVGNRVSLQPSYTALRSTRLIAIGLKDQLVLQSLDDLVASCLFGGGEV